jgi:hypothetical protein
MQKIPGNENVYVIKLSDFIILFSEVTQNFSL